MRYSHSLRGPCVQRPTRAAVSRAHPSLRTARVTPCCGRVVASVPSARGYPEESCTPTQSYDWWADGRKAAPALAQRRPHTGERVGHTKANALSTRRMP